MSLVVALTGPTAVGKSSLAEALRRYGWHHASTSRHLRSLVGPGAGRDELLAAGRRLDRDRPTWLADLCAGHDRVVLDAVGTRTQLADLGGRHRVLLVALTAEWFDLQARRRRRGEPHATEWGGRQDLSGYAQMSVSTSHASTETVAAMVHAWAAGADPVGNRPGYADVVIGGQYGSEGKGHVVSRICGGYDTLVRSGGPNAGHRVWLGRAGRDSYVYHHLPSGTMHNPRAQVFIAAGATLNLPRFMEEVAETDCRDRLTVDPRAVIIDDDDIRAEREFAVGAVGSTAQGVGMATARRVMRGALVSVRTAADVPELRPNLGDVADAIGARVRTGGRVLLEGTQGAGLSLYHGPYPHCTSRDTNVAGLLAECGVAPADLRRTLVVFRTHPIRVAGNSGPMTGELTWEDVARTAGVNAETLRERERTSTTKRLRRVAGFDWLLFARTCRLNRPTHLALTFADYLDPAVSGCPTMEEALAFAREPLRVLVERMQEESGAPVALMSTGFGDPAATVLERGWL